ncbi:MAG TPA: hypothetical protein VMX74_14970, partial [Pirellulales bacterium]|nr:hypothetical protein [Pirellulales bacterium]
IAILLARPIAHATGIPARETNMLLGGLGRAAAGAAGGGGAAVGAGIGGLGIGIGGLVAGGAVAGAAGVLGGAALGTTQGGTLTYGLLRNLASHTPNLERGSFGNQFLGNLVDPLGFGGGAGRDFLRSKGFAGGDTPGLVERYGGRAGRIVSGAATLGLSEIGLAGYRFLNRPVEEAEASERAVARAESGREGLIEAQRRFGSTLSRDEGIKSAGEALRSRLNLQLGKSGLDPQETLSLQIGQRKESIARLDARAAGLDARAAAVRGPSGGENVAAIENESAKVRVESARQVRDMELERVRFAEQGLQIDRQRLDATQGAARSAFSGSQDLRQSFAERINNLRPQDLRRGLSALDAVRSGGAVTQRQLQDAARVTPDSGPDRNRLDEANLRQFRKIAPELAGVQDAGVNLVKTFLDAANAEVASHSKPGDLAKAFKDRMKQADETVIAEAPKLIDTLVQKMMEALKAAAEAAEVLGAQGTGSGKQNHNRAQ